MEAEKMLQADLLDLIFENRNKAYGAYALRKEYDNRLYKAMGLVFIMLTVLYLLLPSGSKIKMTPEKITQELSTQQIVMEPPKKEMPPKAPPVASVKSSTSPSNPHVASSVIQLVDSNMIKKSPVSSLDSLALTKPGKGSGIMEGPGLNIPGPDSGTVKKATGGGGVTHTNTILDNADVMPSFPGGMQALHHFLEMNLQNPETMDAGERIAVKVKFVVGYDGKLKNFEIIQDGGKAFNNEVVRVIRKMPDWIPGKSKGENVSVYHVIPVIFVGEEQ